VDIIAAGNFGKRFRKNCAGGSPRAFDGQSVSVCGAALMMDVDQAAVRVAIWSSETGGLVTTGPDAEWLPIVQLEAVLHQSKDEHCCEGLDVYAAVNVFSERLPIVFTFIGRIDDLSAHITLGHQWLSVYPPGGGGST
jgi:hypothetical protein